MSKKYKHKDTILFRRRQPPIVIVPDKTYIDDTGNVIPTDVILISDPTMYGRMSKVLEFWESEGMDFPGQKGIIER